MQALLGLINQQEWDKIYNEYKVEKIIKILSFKQAMSLAYQMLINKQGADNLREYSVKLLEAISQFYSNEWNSDWKNELMLGDAYYFIMNFSEQHKAYIRSTHLIFPWPSALLVALANCYLNSSNPSHQAIEEAEKMLKEALKQEESVEAVILMRSICRIKEDKEQFLYWNRISESVEEKKAYIKNKLPEILKPEFGE